MAGLYLHIPFCKQACHYCDFHFTTSLHRKEELIRALLTELTLRAVDGGPGTVDTIYLGGGTPSLLSAPELMAIFECIYGQYKVATHPEITIEANPDDLTAAYLTRLKQTPVNRLSIGIQSFRDEDLQRMNRAHTGSMALRCVPEAAAAGFDNISIDLIYGLPFLDMEAWQENVHTAFSLPVQHLSCYGLTVEAKTALAWQITKGQMPAPDEDMAAAHYAWLLEESETAGFPWYEISNFSKPGFKSKHNTAYWEGVPYVGIGPSAHSFNGLVRSWNVSSNAQYVKEINAGILPSESEVLSHKERFHELLLTSLRMRKGLTLSDIRSNYGNAIEGQLIEEAGKFVEKGWLEPIGKQLRLTKQGLLFADKITAELFIF